ncbi:hypothetical protein CE91St30_23640 [Raoultibacter timonensis]|uniref:Uncharacterized protein n=1 Tax=Raoultibacter timonensis TaxID=1907662 RepID=A0ABN6ML83_9ACTN|nr:hypothetical protein CE91St30_23640 [Raoultibacter timonensis]BDF51635.1 hypothetical protein CE91St31_23650 [Raoultibacter timonensis]
MFANAQGMVEKTPGITGKMTGLKTFTLNGGSAVYREGSLLDIYKRLPSMTFDSLS